MRSIYLAIAADAYLTYGDDLLRTLAGRIYAMLNIAPFNVERFVAEAKRAGIDGVVSLTGVPVLRLGVDKADAP